MYREANRIISEWIPGTTLNLSKLNLTKLPNIPNGVEDLDVSNNKITYIHSLPRTVKILDCSNNKISHIENLPNGIEKINLGFNKLKTLNLAPYNRLKYINLIWNLLTQVPVLPVSAKVLLLSHNSFSTLNSINSNLLELEVQNCGLDTIEKLPITLESFSCEGNYLKVLPHLPISLNRINCAYNELSTLPALPPNLKILNCNNNKLIFLPFLPPSLTILNAEYNCIQVQPIITGQVNVNLNHNPFNINLVQNYKELPKIPKIYKIIKNRDVVINRKMGTAYDFFNLEDVDIEEYLSRDDKNIILVLGKQKYAVSRDDLIDYLNTTIFVYNTDAHYRTPWNQIIHYSSALWFLYLDASIFEFKETNLKVSKNEIDHKLYEIKVYKYIDYTT
jgi:hypothetical protein